MVEPPDRAVVVPQFCAQIHLKSSPFHTLDDVCAEYGLDREAFEAELRAAIAGGDQG